MLLLSAIGLHLIFNRAGTTKSFTLVSPPPAVVGGLVQDVAAESQPGYKAGVAAFKRLYAKKVHLSPAGSVIALYQGQATDPNVPTASNVVIYVGFKVPEDDDTAGSLSAAMRGVGARLTNVSTVPVGGGLGDTSFECVTGNGAVVTDVPGQVTTCGWATDRTLAFLIRQGPDPGAKKLSALMLKLWPTLVHH